MTRVDSGVGVREIIARIRDSMYEHAKTNGEHCMQGRGGVLFCYLCSFLSQEPRTKHVADMSKCVKDIDECIG